MWADRFRSSASRKNSRWIVKPCCLDAAVAFCYRINMSQPVKLSDELVLDARLVGEGLERSIAGQIEFWARLGRAIEPVLQVRQAKALAEAPPPTPVSECVKIVGSE